MKKKTPKKLRKFIPVEEAIARWRKDPKYMEAYNALEEEFSLLEAMIKARATAGLTQKELAKRMKTSQGAVARLENSSTLPSTRTLKRFAEATGHRLKISFEAIKPNKTTRRAMKEMKTGKGKKYPSVASMMDDLRSHT